LSAGKDRETIDRFSAEASSDYPRAQIRWAGWDVRHVDTEAITHHCPSVTCVIDPFCPTKALNAAVDAVRNPWPARSARRSRTRAGEPYRRAATRIKDWTCPLNRLRHCNRYIHCARVLKDEFAHSRGLTYPGAVEKVLRLRLTSAPRSRFPRAARSSAR
jgi:hypothetical protein